MFDEGGRKTRFAQYDEAATCCALDLALPIIERAPGLETGFMRKRYAKVYPLRDGVEPFHYEIDANEDKFWSVGYPKDRRTATWYAIPQNTWLCLGVDNSVIQSAVSKQGKEQQSTNALTVSISRHSEDAPSHGKLDLRWNGVIASWS